MTENILVNGRIEVKGGSNLHCVKDRTSVFERATSATFVGASTNPTSVQQPDVGIVLGDLL